MVGFGGGSSYNALLVLFGVDHHIYPIIALLCNLIVVTGGCWLFIKRKILSTRLLLPFIITSIPMAYITGQLVIDKTIFLLILGIALFISGLIMIFNKHLQERLIAPEKNLHLWSWGLPIGACLGSLAGLVGIGGGIFLRGAVSSNVYNNTIIGAGIHIKSGGSPENREFNSKNNRISDNIIWATGNDGIVIVDKNNDAGLLLEDNCYWREKGSGEFRVNGTWYKYNDYKSKFVFDANSVFTNPGEIDKLMLPVDGPCSGKGIKMLVDKRLDVLLYNKH